MAKYYQIDFYAWVGEHGVAGDYDTLDRAFDDAKKILAREKRKGTLKELGYIGVESRGDEFAVVYITEEYLKRIIRKEMFKEESAYENWMDVANKVLKTGKPMKGTFSEGEFEAGGSIGRQYYVKQSSWFDTHEYDKNKISSAVEKAGGKNVHAENQFGWSNQPEVIVFNAKDDDLDKIKKSVQDAVGTEWIIISEKDWKVRHKMEKGGKTENGNLYEIYAGNFLEGYMRADDENEAIDKYMQEGNYRQERERWKAKKVTYPSPKDAIIDKPIKELKQLLNRGYSIGGLRTVKPPKWIEIWIDGDVKVATVAMGNFKTNLFGNKAEVLIDSAHSPVVITKEDAEKLLKGEKISFKYNNKEGYLKLEDLGREYYDISEWLKKLRELSIETLGLRLGIGDKEYNAKMVISGKENKMYLYERGYGNTLIAIVSPEDAEKLLKTNEAIVDASGIGKYQGKVKLFFSPDTYEKHIKPEIMEKGGKAGSKKFSGAIKVESYLPVFTGFYNTIFEPDESSVIESPYEYDDYDFDYETYHNEVAKKCTEVVGKWLKDFDIKAKFQNLYSPKYYNYSNDSINVEYTLGKGSMEKILEYLENNKGEFQRYLKDTYTSRDGFISHYTNDYDKWINDLKSGESLNHILGSTLEFILQNEGHDQYELNEKVSDYVYLTGELKKEVIEREKEEKEFYEEVENIARRNYAKMSQQEIVDKIVEHLEKKDADYDRSEIEKTVKKIYLEIESKTATLFSKGGKTKKGLYAEGEVVNGVIVVDVDKEFDDNPLFYIWSEYPTNKKLSKEGYLIYSYEFYTDKKGNKYLLVSDLKSAQANEITALIKEQKEKDSDWTWARNVDEFVEGADADKYNRWLDLISVKGGEAGSKKVSTAFLEQYEEDNPNYQVLSYGDHWVLASHKKTGKASYAYVPTGLIKEDDGGWDGYMNFDLLSHVAKPYDKIFEKELKNFDVRLHDEGTEYYEKIFEKMGKGGKIKNLYDGKTAQEIWDNGWDNMQKWHFYRDHIEGKPVANFLKKYEKIDDFGSIVSKKYDELPPAIKNEISLHVLAGSYGKGGKIKNQYAGKSAQEVWDNMMELYHKIHLLSDHKSKSPILMESSKKTGWAKEFAEKKFNELPEEIREVVDDHISRGQYGKGGLTKTSDDIFWLITGDII